MERMMKRNRLTAAGSERRRSVQGAADAAVPEERGCLRRSGPFLLIAAMFFGGCMIALLAGIPVKSVMKEYSYDVIVIMIIMELFTVLVAETGIMQAVSVKLAEWSGGRRRLCLVMFGGMMFVISSCLNNITAITMILPVVFVLLGVLETDRKYCSIFFAVLLALSNTGGAASPVGDFPAVLIMTSGITSFTSYLVRAFPLFAATSAVLLLFWGLRVKKETEDGGLRQFAVLSLKSRYRYVAVHRELLAGLEVIFALMFGAWALVPQEVLPPEIIAVLGYGAAMLVCAFCGRRVEQTLDLRPVLTIASFLFFAQVVSRTGVLDRIAGFLCSSITDPKTLILVLMVITSITAGIFSAGPAAAAMLPVIAEVCSGPLGAQSDWIAVLYAASICAGSSLFLWSATGGFLLSGRIGGAGIQDPDGHPVTWGVGQYLKYGLVSYALQLTIALAVAAFVL